MKNIFKKVGKTPSFFLKISIPLVFSIIFLFPLFYYLVLIWSSGIAGNVNSYFIVKDINEIEFVKNKPLSWTKYEETSKGVVWAIILSEDWAFYEHSGVDWQQMMIVLKEGAKKFEIKRGASTITQQVVKNLYLTNEKSFFRKFNEIILAFYLEGKSTKKWILEQYLNVAEFDKNVFGIKSAAWHYFKKSPRNLTFKEGAFLAMLLPSPKKYSVSYYKKNLTPFARKQVSRILGKMVVAHVISKEQMYAEISTPFSWESSPDAGTWESLDAIIESAKTGEDVDEIEEKNTSTEPIHEEQIIEENQNEPVVEEATPTEEATAEPQESAPVKNESEEGTDG